MSSNKVLVKRYLYSNKEDNWDLVDKFGHKGLAYVGYEVEFLVEIDTKTGDFKIVGCEGQFLDNNQSYKSEEITEVEDNG